MQQQSGKLRGRLQTALDRVTAGLAALKQRNTELGDAGCTLVAAAIEDASLSWISVGDSSLRLLRAGTIRRLNDDHSMRPVYADLVRSGRMTESQAATNPNRSALRSALTGENPSIIDQSKKPITILPGDQLILASDGLDVLNPKRISEMLIGCSERTPLSAVGAILDAISNMCNPHQDNVTVVLYRA